MLQGLRGSLLLKVVVTLVAVGLLPLAISFFQLWTTEDALVRQVQRTHLVAAKTAAERVDSYLRSLLTLARSTATNPVLYRDPLSEAAQELLRGTLEALPDAVAVGVFSPTGETVVLAQRIDVRDEIAALRQTAGEADAREADLSIARGLEQRWILVRQPLPDGAGELDLVARVEPLVEMVQSREIGEEAQLVLVSREREVLAGDATSLEEFPPGLVEAAASGKIESRATRWDEPPMESLVVAHAEVASAPWFVLSRQPARIAEVARQRIVRATWLSALGAMALAALLSSGAYVTVIRPLRRLAAAQGELAGVEGSQKGSEIDQLEASFELLQQRVRDSEDLGKVFLGRYQVTELIGSGAMGSVFRGWDPKLKRPVALKTVHLDSEQVNREKLINSLLEEAVISARFNDPNIVTVYDIADEGNAAFLAMEFVDGVSLDSYLWARGQLEPKEVIPLAAAIARGLATAHQNGLVHHDVKPGNVLLGYDGSIKVTDFGISRLITSATQSQEVICGTPGYLAPECYMGEGYTPRSDLFSLGLICYEALTGDNPFFGKNVKDTMVRTIMNEPPAVEPFAPGLPPEFAELTRRLMAKEPSERPPDATEVAQELERMAAAHGFVWSPDRETLVRLKPMTSGTRTQLVTLSRAPI